jgi:hypothetical protein
MATDLNLVFVRVSVNAVTPGVVERHWGVRQAVVASQLDGIGPLLAARRRALAAFAHARAAVPSLQVSWIVDAANVDLGTGRRRGEPRAEGGDVDFAHVLGAAFERAIAIDCCGD